MIATAATPPAEPGGGRGPRSTQLASRTGAERRARTGDLLQTTKALLIRER
jgi:hypothetical protein